MRGEKAKKLAKCFSKGVVKVVKGEDGESYAKVVNPRRDTCSREVFRHEDLKDCVQLSRVRDHFICEHTRSSEVGCFDLLNLLIVQFQWSPQAVCLLVSWWWRL